MRAPDTTAKARSRSGSRLPLPARVAARRAISLTPPPAGITPIDASASPIGLIGAATTRVQCISTSQPPETATPAAHCNCWDARVAQGQHRLLVVVEQTIERRRVTACGSRYGVAEICAVCEVFLTLADHEHFETRLGERNGSVISVEHRRGDRRAFAFERNHERAVASVPAAEPGRPELDVHRFS
jgi:hypothetical protein